MTTGGGGPRLIVKKELAAHETEFETHSNTEQTEPTPSKMNRVERRWNIEWREERERGWLSVKQSAIAVQGRGEGRVMKEKRKHFEGEKS